MNTQYFENLAFCYLLASKKCKAYINFPYVNDYSLVQFGDVQCQFGFSTGRYKDSVWHQANLR